MCHARCLPRRRAAFTLIELLVVMALILGITALGIGYVVFGTSHETAVKGAQAVYGALLNARQTARRDSLPTGVRILFGTNTSWRRRRTSSSSSSSPRTTTRACARAIRRRRLTAPAAGYDLYTVLFNPGGTNSQGLPPGSISRAAPPTSARSTNPPCRPATILRSTAPLTPHRINTVSNDAAAATVPALKLDSPVTVPLRLVLQHHPRAAAFAERGRHHPAAQSGHRQPERLCQNLPLRSLVDSTHRRPPIRPLARRSPKSSSPPPAASSARERAPTRSTSGCATRRCRPATVRR